MAKILPNKFVDDLIDRQAIGVSIPFSKSSVFNQTFTTADQVKSNLINYFLTNKGERILNPTYGGDLRSLLFEQINDDTIMSIQDSILDIFKIWLPFVEVRDIQIITNSDNTSVHSNEVRVNIIFNIIQDPNTLDSVTINFSSNINDSSNPVGSGGGY